MSIENGSFGPESTNPRLRRAFAHAMICRYKQGEASYGEAFSAAYNASHNRKGRNSNFGRSLGNVFVDAYAQRFDNNTVVVSGLSTTKQAEVAVKEASGRSYGYSPDAYMVRPDANNRPQLKGIIKDPIEEGFTLLN